MTIEVIESFDLVSSSADLVRKGWSYAEGTVVAGSGVFGGNGYKSSSVNDILSKSIPFIRYTTLSFYFKNESVTPSSGYIVRLLTPQYAHCGIRFDTAGSIILEGITSTVGVEIKNISDTGVITPNTWHYIECQFDVDDAGTCIIKVDGVVVASALSDFKAYYVANTDPVFFGAVGTNVFDDIVVQTSAVSQPPFLGNIKITAQYPSADTTQADWTGTFADIDDPLGAADGDTTFISATTLNAKSEFELTDLAVSPTTVFAVQTITEARKTDAGDKLITPYLLSGVTRGDGLEIATSEAYSVRSNIYELDPATSAAWTESSINALKVGVEITG